MNTDLSLDKLAEWMADCERRRAPVWDALWARQSIDRIAVGVWVDIERVKQARKNVETLAWPEPDRKPAGWNIEWRYAVLHAVSEIVAGLSLPGDGYHAITPPRFVHGQSQGLCDLFGAQSVLQADGNHYVPPLPPDPKRIDAITVRPLETSEYWGAVEWVRYARSMTGGLFPFRNPVMTSPFDTANYLLGTTVLLEWVYTEPDVLQRLLAKITDALIGMIGALGEAAGGRLAAPHHTGCVRGGFDLCSECRSLVSREIYEQFEAPCLRRIGETLGPYSIHSCGSWERTVPSALQDPNLRVMNGQIRENDLRTLCDMAQGRITLAIAPSTNLSPAYTWPDMRSFYDFIIKTTPSTQPLGIVVSESNLDLWNRLCREHKAAACVIEQ